MPLSWSSRALRSGSRLMMRWNTAGRLSVPKGAPPVAAKTIVPAQANRSAAGPACSPASCSGVMYAGVPTTIEVSVELLSSALAMPKSMTRGPSVPSRTLEGLKSRWTMPAWWIATRAVTVPIASRCRAAPWRGPSRSTTASRVGPSMYSLTMNGRWPATPVSITCAVQNVATRSAVETSLTNLASASSFWARSERSTLTATVTPAGERPR